MSRRSWWALWLLGLLAGCASVPEPPAPAGSVEPRIEAQAWIASDGRRLPLTRWQGGGQTRGVILALHGFSEHRGAFFALAPHLAARGYTVYAYDQRGFGGTASRGYWAGTTRLVEDARTLYRLLQRRYPEQPVHLLGHSMGAAIATLAITGERAIEPASAILIAPGFQGWDTLPWLRRVALRFTHVIAPGLQPRQRWARAFAEIQVTDDPVIARLQARDPQILHKVRIDMIHGVVELMDRAVDRIEVLPRRSLIQYGERDDIIPVAAACAMFERLMRAQRTIVLRLYPNGYHYLTRDRQRERTIRDIRAWLGGPVSRSDTPSTAITPEAAHDRMCH